MSFLLKEQERGRMEVGENWRRNCR